TGAPRCPPKGPHRYNGSGGPGVPQYVRTSRSMTDRATRPPGARERLRALPSVDRLATAVARAELAERRTELLSGATSDVDLVERARERLRPSLRRVLNATGVVVHTNLGRAPLAEEARAA